MYKIVTIWKKFAEKVILVIPTTLVACLTKYSSTKMSIAQHERRSVSKNWWNLLLEIRQWIVCDMWPQWHWSAEHSTSAQICVHRSDISVFTCCSQGFLRVWQNVSRYNRVVFNVLDGKNVFLNQKGSRQKKKFQMWYGTELYWFFHCEIAMG